MRLLSATRSLLISFVVMGSAYSNAALADTLTCNDEREAKTQISINLETGGVEIRRAGQPVEKLSGVLQDCAGVDESQGADQPRTTCDYVQSGDLDSSGTVTSSEDGSGFYNLNLADQNFRGSCTQITTPR